MLFSYMSWGQNRFVISGTVRDKKDVLAGASVYVSGFKMSTISNSEGKFTLPALQPGNYDLLIQIIGYQPHSKSVSISNKDLMIDIQLLERPLTLEAVEIKPDPDRPFYLGMFKDFFLGTTPNARLCKILNPEILRFNYDKNKQILTAESDEFLIIENLALGYRIKYLLSQFEYNYNDRMLYYAGYPTFEDLEGNKTKKKKWARLREIAYYGSAQHFFTALYKKKLTENGFIIYKRYQIPNKDRQPDSAIQANINQLRMNGGSLQLSTTNLNANSMSYWLKEKRKPKFLHLIDRNELKLDTLIKNAQYGLKGINYENELFVVYKGEKEPEGFINTSFYENRTPDLSGYQISVVKMLLAPIYFYDNGIVYNPKSTLYSGFWSYEKMADTVPMDFLPSDPPKSEKKSK